MDLVYKLGKESLYLQRELFIDLNHLLVSKVLEFGTFHVYNHLNLVHIFLALQMHLFRFKEFDSPSMFQLLDEKMDEQVGMVVQNTQQLHKFDLPDLNDKDWTALFIYSMEAIWTELLNLLKLLELEVLFK